MLAHYPVSSLKLGPSYNQESYVVLARRPIRKAVVFIHGYSGDPLTTWAEFHKLLPQAPEFVGFDFFFYGHDGLFATTPASATLLYEFLNRLFTDTSSITNPVLPNVDHRPPGFTYDKVILAAHSLGAVICRWALLYARDNNRAWMDRTAMVLYAPAHKGARVAKLITELGVGPGILTSALHFVGLAVKYASPLIDQLAANSSHLQSLLDQTTQALTAGGCEYLKARKVVVAEYERVVEDERFAQDAWPPVTFAGADHISVCKPKPPTYFPLVVLSKVSEAL